MTSIFDKYPEFLSTAELDLLRASDYGHLDSQDHVYLDYTGSGLAAVTQLRNIEKRLVETVYGNPHSVNPTSAATTQAIEQTRARILAFVNASPTEYTVIFTPNATGAARLVGEAYPFCRSARLVLTADNHNSINGIREFGRAKGAKTIYIPLQKQNLRVRDADVTAALSPRSGFLDRLGLSCRLPPKSPEDGPRRPSRGLFAYPAQSNFTGVRHPLSWIWLAQQHGYHVLLDAAAYLPTARLDLSVVKPDFVIVSWYKLFGYPTGLGSLIARNDSLEYLRPRRPWFSGGTIEAATVSVTWHMLATGNKAFEDGTPNFLCIPDVHFGLDWLSRIGLSTIETRVRCLTGWFLDRLLELRHSDGSPMATVYGPADLVMRGGTVAFNLLDVARSVVDGRLVAMESAAARISLRTGCFCNPGAAEYALQLDGMLIRRLFVRRGPSRMIKGLAHLQDIPSTGAVRVSFGFVSTANDVEKLLGFVTETYRDRRVVE